MLTSEARLALLAISRQFPNGAEVLRHEIETKDAEIERLTKPDAHVCLTCVHCGTPMSEYPCLECGQHYDRSDLWEPALEGNSHA